MKSRLPLRQFDATDPVQLREWFAELRRRHPDPVERDEVLLSVVGQLGREYQKVAAALKARGRGQRGGGSEAFDTQTVIGWAELADERVDEDASGAAVASAGETATEPANTQPGSGEPKLEPKPKGHRRAFPDSWERRRFVIPVAADERACPICGVERTCFDHDVAEVLAIEPAKLYVKQIAREKLACPQGHGSVVTPPAAPRLVEQSACDLSLSLDLLDRKLIQHLPVYRIAQIYARLGVPVSDKTLNRWYHDGLRALAPVAEALRLEARSPERFLVNIDDTASPILDRDAEEGLTIGHLWLVVGDHRFVSATVSEDWTKEHAAAALGSWTGYVQCDAYRGFDHLFRGAERVEVGCWAHARRYFVKALDRGDPLAREALGLIGRLYAVEQEATEKGLTPAERRALRQERSRPTLDLLWRWHQKVGKKVRPRSPLGRALTYMKNQWTALQRYLEDGRLPLTNMVVEREMRPIALGRKNWLFLGNLEAAKRFADGVTVVASARMHDVDPVAYLRWLLPQLARREWSVEAARAALLPAHFQQALKQQDAEGSLV